MVKLPVCFESKSTATALRSLLDELEYSYERKNVHRSYSSVAIVIALERTAMVYRYIIKNISTTIDIWEERPNSGNITYIEARGEDNLEIKKILTSLGCNLKVGKKNIKVFFAPSGKQGLVDSNQTVLQIARSLGVDIDSVCGGRAMCGRCQIEVSEGEFAKHGISSKSENLSKRTHSEKRYSEKRNLNVSRRLSCQARINEDVVIDVPPESQVHRQVIRKAIDDREVIIDPVINLYFVEVREPSMHDPSGDFQRLIEALKLQWNLSTKDEIAEGSGKLFEKIMSGQVKVKIFKKYKLEEVEQAHKDLESRKITGPAIIIP